VYLKIFSQVSLITLPHRALASDRAIPTVDFKSYFNSHRSETWYELFYDLVFVAASIQIGTIIKYNISAMGLLKAGILFTVFRATWDQVMFYQNKFDTKDLVHYIYYLIQAMLVFIMALHLTLDHSHQWDVSRNMTAISLSAGISRFYAVIMYLQVMTITKNYRSHIVSVAVAQFFSGTLFFLAPYLGDEQSFYWFWFTSIAIERVLVHIRIALWIPLKERAPPHFGHLSHRQVTTSTPSDLTLSREPSSYSSLAKQLFNLFKVVVAMVGLILLVA
jgi:low temperature requirement protein LtrA